MKMNLGEFAKECYENAEAHGFWEPAPDLATMIALIHSEWSEALEEYRAGRSMLWYECVRWGMERDKGAYCLELGRQGSACFGQGCCKPNGIAVELIDGVLRILDIAGRFDMKMEPYPLELFAVDKSRLLGCSISYAVTFLHARTTCAWHEWMCKGNTGAEREFRLIVSFVLEWIRHQGIDPEGVMIIKHSYNKTRPYRHGGKIC